MINREIGYPLTVLYGIMGTAIAATLPSALVVVLTLHEAGKIIGESFTYIAGNFMPAIISSLIICDWGCGVYWVSLVDEQGDIL